MLLLRLNVPALLLFLDFGYEQSIRNPAFRILVAIDFPINPNTNISNFQHLFLQCKFLDIYRGFYIINIISKLSDNCTNNKIITSLIYPQRKELWKMIEVQYHIKVKTGDVGRYVLLPGDPGRCESIAAYLDESEICFIQSGT